MQVTLLLVKQLFSESKSSVSVLTGYKREKYVFKVLYLSQRHS